MKVLLLTHEYPPFIFGGVGSFAKELANGLARLGVNVTVVSGFPVLDPRKKITQEREDGITVYRLPYPNIQPRHTMFQLANLKRLTSIVDEVSPNVIHGQSAASFPALLNLKKGAPFLVTFHTSPLMEKITSIQSISRGGSLADFRVFAVGYPVWSFTFKEELKHSDCSVAVSNTLRTELLREMGEQFIEKIQVIHNGVNLEALDREYKGRNGKFCEKSDKLILFAGRFFWRKGVLSLIKLASLLQKKDPEYRIIMHGTGPLFSKVQMRIQSLRLPNVELKGFTTRAELVQSMRRCKFVVIPSFYEACPIALIEAMCLGKIPLMFNLPFSSELTDGGRFGIIADDVTDMVRKLTAFGEKDQLDSFGNEISVFARDTFDMNESARKYLDLYRELS